LGLAASPWPKLCRNLGNTANIVDELDYSAIKLELTVVAYDVAGNKKKQTVFVKVDNSEPQVYISPYNDKSVVTGNVQITIYAFDKSGIEKLETYFDEQKIHEGKTGFAVLNINTSEYEEKPYTLKVIVQDKYGNKSEKYITLIIDRTPPKVSFVDLRDGSKITKESSIVVTASDENGVSKVELYVAGQKVGEITSEPYEFNLNLRDGVLKLKTKTNGDILSW